MPKDLPFNKSSDEDILLQKGYKLFKKIGEGSYAPVYYTEYIGPKGSEEPKALACKIIDLKKAPKDYVKKFLPRELEVLSIVNHPHIIHIQSIFQRKFRYYVFMSMAEKGDLLDYLLTNGALAEGRAKVWFRQIALAVQYLHEIGIAHRDLKCENCLISSNNNLKLADFGFSRFAINGEGRNITSSTYCGSLNYAAPEVLKGSPYYPKISDCWSLGVILYAMLNKSMPFEDKNVRELVSQQMKRKWKWRSKVVEFLSGDVKNLVKQLIEPDTQLRLKASDIIDSEWIRSDPRLNVLTPDEERCLTHAKTENFKYTERHKQRNVKGIINPDVTSNKMKEIKGESDENTRNKYSTSGSESTSTARYKNESLNTNK